MWADDVDVNEADVHEEGECCGYGRMMLVCVDIFPFSLVSYFTAV